MRSNSADSFMCYNLLYLNHMICKACHVTPGGTYHGVKGRQFLLQCYGKEYSPQGKPMIQETEGCTGEQFGKWKFRHSKDITIRFHDSCRQIRVRNNLH